MKKKMLRDINILLNRKRRNFILWFVVIVFGVIVIKLWQNQQELFDKPNYTDFYQDVINQKIEQATLSANKLKGKYSPEYKGGKNFIVVVPIQDPTLYNTLRANVKGFKIKNSNNLFSGMLMSLIPMLFIFGVLWLIFIVRVGGGNIGGGSMKFGKNRAKLIRGNRERITFNDIAGVQEAKEEVEEIIEFLKNPKHFQKLGGRIPKGVLLIGPPGTGKTLLAKAIAGEAKVPFFSISGSDFVEMFAGVGASRVRNMFLRAKRNAPCIIFLDEIDAIGKYRSMGVDNSNDERDQTLNALLVEMDGFNTQEGVIIIAATNRPDMLDPALLRPGRFDRQVALDLPDIKGRLGILKVHTSKILLADSVDIEKTAKGTPGFSGADLANLVNESALLAARMNKSFVEQSDLDECRDKVKWGKERRSRPFDDEDRKITAYHEAGHALVLRFLPEAQPLHKVTIIPRGTAFMGATMQLPQKDKYTETKKQILAEITGLMGGRAAEEIIFGDITTASTNDIGRATKIAKLMVCQWGMSDKFGPVMLGDAETPVSFNKERVNKQDYSQATAVDIDNEVKKIIWDCYNKAVNLLKDNKGILIEIAELLLRKEVLESYEIEPIINSGLVNKQNTGEFN